MGVREAIQALDDGARGAQGDGSALVTGNGARSDAPASPAPSPAGVADVQRLHDSTRPVLPEVEWERGVRDFVAFIDHERWHNFPVSIREFHEYAERFLTARLRARAQGGTP